VIGAVEVQLVNAVTSEVDESEYVPVTVNWSKANKPMEKFVGDTLIEVTIGAVTDTYVKTVTPPAVAVSMAPPPWISPVTRPAVFTDATRGSEELH
jgi:hypothetical protein